MQSRPPQWRGNDARRKAQLFPAQLLRRLLAIGRDEQIGCVSAVVLPYNHGMLRICEKLGFHTVFDEGDRLINARLELVDPGK